MGRDPGRNRLETCEGSAVKRRTDDLERPIETYEDRAMEGRKTLLWERPMGDLWEGRRRDAMGEKPMEREEPMGEDSPNVGPATTYEKGYGEGGRETLSGGGGPMELGICRGPVEDAMEERKTSTLRLG